MRIRFLFALGLFVLPVSAFAQTAEEPVPVIPRVLDSRIDPTLVGEEPVVTEPVEPTPAEEPAVLPTPTPIPVPTLAQVEQIQEGADTAADLTSGPLSNILSAVAGAMGGVLALLGVQQALKGNKGKNDCPHCQGTGETPAVCHRCNGAKEVEQEYEPKMDCADCEGSGEDPEERRDEHGKPLDCEACKGEGEVSAKLNVSVPCPDCN